MYLRFSGDSRLDQRTNMSTLLGIIIQNMAKQMIGIKGDHLLYN